MYEVALRVLSCEWCGAPVRGSAQGGVFTCAFCQAKLVLEARARPRPLAPSMSEPERIELLWARVDEDQSRGVAGFSHLIKDGLHDPGQLKEGLAEWNKARAELARNPSQQAVDRFFVFSKVVADQLDDREQKRAVLETASELLPDAADRSSMYARLSRLAANAGELDAARAWLDLCDARSSAIEADMEYRVSHARLQLALQNYLGVFESLGLRDGLVPIHTRARMLAGVYRAEAYERLGDLHSAVAELTIQARRSATRLVAINDGLFCHRSLELALAAVRAEA